jgi:hypothetical protein
MLVKKWAILQKPHPCQMGPTKQLALIMALCWLHNFYFGDNGPPECSGNVPANSDDLTNTTGAANEAATIESEIGNIVSPMIDGGEHFEDVLDEELAEQLS